ncbi:MAG: sulfatase-like hydrolase/transferase [Cyclobacteriaceae bacterium]
MKKFALFNFSCASAYLLALVNAQSISWVTLFVHLIILSYGMLMMLYALRLMALFTSNKVINYVTLIILFSSYSYAVLNYTMLFVAFENWGHPMTLPMLKAYSNETPLLVRSLPWTLGSILTTAVLILTFIFLLSIYMAKNVRSDLVGLKNKKFLLVGFKRRMVLILPVVFLIGLLSWNTVANGIPYRLQLSKDPILSLYIYRAPQADMHFTLDQIISRRDYPEDLSFDKKNIILIICDALRADHIGTYGYNRANTPFLDSMADIPNAIKLENYYATSSNSMKGIINTLTSNYNTDNNQFGIHDLLKKQGYIINFVLSGDHTNFYGLRKAYGENLDLYHDGFTMLQQGPENQTSVNDDLLVLKNLEQLNQYSGDPNFFYLHYMSAHQSGKVQSKYEHYFPNKANLGGLDSVTLINDYDNRMAQLDDYLRQSFNELKSKGFFENAILIVTGDHGQALMENGRYWHAKSTDWSEIKIPFIMIQTGASVSKKYDPAQIANQLDLGPTLIDMLELPKPDVWQGRSIFGNDHRDWIFQRQKPYYATIWSENQTIYQYSYNRQSESERYFQFESRGAIAINSSEPLKADSARNAVRVFFSLKK